MVRTRAMAGGLMAAVLAAASGPADRAWAGAFDRRTSQDPAPASPLERFLTPGRSNVNLSAGLEIADSDRRFNDEGESVRSPGHLTRTRLSLGVEYGVTSRFSMGFWIPFDYLTYRVEHPDRLARMDTYRPTGEVSEGQRFNTRGLGDARLGIGWDPLRIAGERRGSYGFQLSVHIPSGDASSAIDRPFVFNRGQGLVGLEGGVAARQMLSRHWALQLEGSARGYFPEDSDYILSVSETTSGQSVNGNARVRMGEEYRASALLETELDDGWLLGLQAAWLFKARSEYDNKILLQNIETGELRQKIERLPIPHSEMERTTVSPRMEYRWEKDAGVRIHAVVPVTGRNTDALFPNYFNAYCLRVDWIWDL